MASELFVLTLVRAQAAASLAVLLVLVLRAPARRRIGVGLTYRLWLLVAVAAFISPFPTPSEFLLGDLAIITAAGVWVMAPSQRYETPAPYAPPSRTATALTLQLSPALRR